MSESEGWREVEGWPYEVSSLGRVRNRSGRVLAQLPHNHGYMQVWMANRGRRGKEYVHRIVARAWWGEPPAPDCHADHINGVRSDNRASNVRWLSPTENRALRRFSRGEAHCCTKLSDETVRMLRADRTINNAEMARRLGVRRETIRDIRLGKERRHVR